MHDDVIRKQSDTRTYPLAAVQTGMLLDGLRALRKGAYIQQLVGTLREELNIPLFREAWQRLVERHEVLRTSFDLEGHDRPTQRVHPRIECELEVSDWRDLDVRRGEERLTEYLRDDRRRGFALECPPHWRLHLFSFGETEHRFVWTSHHALFDGRSRVILLHELFTVYDALLSGTSVSLAPPLSFEDHVRGLHGRDFEASQAYWQELLAGLDDQTTLSEHTAGSVSGDPDQHQTLELQLTESLSRQLERLAREFDVTLNTILQGAWASILSMDLATDDVVFGATRACRQTSVNGAESIVGLFINTLPMRARVRRSAMLRDWLQELRAQWVAMRDHEQTPLALVRDWSGVGHDKALFESIVVFERLPLQESLRMRGGHWENRSMRLLGITNYPMVVAGYGGSRIRIELTYDRRRFSAEAVLSIRNRLQNWLEEVASNPLRTLAEIPLISAQEERKLVADWNATQTTIPRNASVAQLFEAQAARTPGAVALDFKGGQWTYEELNLRANRLAHRLREMGAGLETPIAICTERSPEMVSGILAILKTGGAYVPLDPTDPHERTAAILQDAQTKIILTQRSLVSMLPLDGIDAVCLDDLESADDPRTATNAPCPATFESLAYVMYTSGSTGTPKGVAVPHRGIIRLVFGVDYAVLDASRTILHLASPAFDASTFELWGSLLHGGRCVLYPGRVPALDVLQRVLFDHKVDTLFLTTALFHTIVDDCVQILAGVRQLLVGGEVISVNRVRRALSLLPDTSIVHVYGPTETTTFATSYQVPRHLGDDVSSLPIGMPIGNTSIYLLDTLGRLVPAGVAGELYIGGPGVARGYWGQSDLTAQRFLPNQFDPQSGTHVYRTGDQGRRLPDGNIEFLGRLDGQVKVRGFRIELGEIETVLRRHEAVGDAVVVAVERPDSAGRSLLAYIVPFSDATAPTVEQLRHFLKKSLPAYMVPSAFVVVDELPLTSNGKVDRRRLAAGDPVPTSLEREAVVTARTPVERTLTGIFADLLGCEEVGVHDDFFELGGHSLLAMQVVSRARRALGVELSLASLIEEPTVAALAGAVAALDRNESGDHESPMVRVPRSGAYPILSSQLSIWELHQRFPGHSRLNPSRAYRLRGRLSTAALNEALTVLVERHESLRTSFVAIDGSPAQVVGPAGRIDLPLTDLSHLPEPIRLATAQRLFDEETRHSFDLAHGAMFRPRLLRLTDEDHVLIVIFCHIIMDGWSLGIFNRELSACYEALSVGRPVELPQLPFQPADVATWEQGFMSSAEAQRQIAFWKNHLAGSIPATGLPGVHPELVLRDLPCVHRSIVVPRTIVGGLRELAIQEGCTLSTTLFAAANALLYEATGQHEIRLNIPLAARSRPEVEGLIGCFRKRLILQTNVAGRPTFRQLLVRAKDVLNAAYLHSDVPPEVVFPERGVDHPTNWMNVHAAFNYFHSTDELAGPVNLPGLSTTTLERSEYNGRSIFDLSIFERQDEITVLLRSMRELFSPEAIQTILEDYGTILKRIASKPDERINDVANGEPWSHTERTIGD